MNWFVKILLAVLVGICGAKFVANIIRFFRGEFSWKRVFWTVAEGVVTFLGGKKLIGSNLKK